MLHGSVARLPISTPLFAAAKPANMLCTTADMLIETSSPMTQP